MPTTAEAVLRGHSASGYVTAAGGVLQIGLVPAGEWLHGWAGIGQLTVTSASRLKGASETVITMAERVSCVS